mgnify:CR=1 FL=1
MATVEIDQDLCIGCEVCASTAPDIFEMNGEAVAEVVDGMSEVDGADLDLARDAEAACSVDAITVSE